MEEVFEERKSLTFIQKGDKIQEYKSHEKNKFAVNEDIIGLDANVLVDLAESEEFREEIKTYVQFNVLKICTSSIAT